MSKRKKKKKASDSKVSTTSAAKDAPAAESRAEKAPQPDVPLAPNEGGETAPEPFISEE